MALVHLQDLESFFAPKLVKGIFCDDGSGKPGPRLGTALQSGSDRAMAILGKVQAWQTEEAVEILVCEDAAIREAVCQLVMSVGGNSKPEWFSANQSASQAWRKDARTTLDDFVKRRLRTKAESEAGANTITTPRVENARQFEFARRRGQGPSGGF